MYFLITWTPLGSWLPGDPRGFRQCRAGEKVEQPERYARNGEEIYNPNDYAGLHKYSKSISANAIRLSNEHKKIAAVTIVENASKYAEKGVVCVTLSLLNSVIVAPRREAWWRNDGYEILSPHACAWGFQSPGVSGFISPCLRMGLQSHGASLFFEF